MFFLKFFFQFDSSQYHLYAVINPYLQRGPFELNHLNQFNKYLPYGCIKKIISHLNINDYVNLMISKLFAPYLLQNQNFFDAMNMLWAHVLCQHLTSHTNLYLTSAFTPVILNNIFYVLIDSNQAKTMHFISTKKPGTLNSFCSFTILFDLMFDSYKSYKLAQKISSIKNDWLMDGPIECEAYCDCSYFKYHVNSQNTIEKEKVFWGRRLLDKILRC